MDQVQVNWEDLARCVEQWVLEKMQYDLANWEEDLSMRQMFVQDAADGLRVCEMILTGNVQAIENQLWEMDTAARECVFGFIEQSLTMSWESLRHNMVDTV